MCIRIMCMSLSNSIILFVILILSLIVIPSIPVVHADSSDETTTRPPTTTTKPTTPITTLTPTTRTPTQPITQAPTTLAPTTLAPTAPVPTTATPTATMMATTPAPTTPATITTAPTQIVTAAPTTTVVPPSPVPCGQRGQCSICTMDGQCSWCTETSTCVAQQNPTTCAARAWRTIPSTCTAPAFNPIFQPAQAQTQLAQLGQINATNNFFWANNQPLMNIDPNKEFVYITLNVLTQNAPRALIMHLFVQQNNGLAIEVTPRTNTNTTSFLTISPSQTTIIKACTENANPITGTCTFMLSVTSDNVNPNAATVVQGGNIADALDFKITFARGVMINKLSSQVVDQNGLVNDTVALFGIEPLFPALDVKIALIPDQNNPNTDLDLYVINMNTPNTPLFAGRTNARGTNQPESFIINTAIFASNGALYMIAVVPAQIDAMPKLFTLDFIKNFKPEVTIALSTLGIIAAVAVLVLCIFSIIAVIAKRRRRAILAAQAAANQAAAAAATSPTEPQGLKPEELELIPIHEFEKNSEAASDDSLCSICLCDYDVGQPVRTLACLHHFHISCVDPWLKDHRTCPNCRKDATEGLKVPSSPKALSESGPQIVVDPMPPVPLPSPRGQIPSITYTGGGRSGAGLGSVGSGSSTGSGSHFSHSSPRSAAVSEHVISPMEVEAHFPHYAATQSTGSSSSTNSHPYPSFPSPSPHQTSLSARRLSHPADSWQDAPNALPES